MESITATWIRNKQKIELPITHKPLRVDVRSFCQVYYLCDIVPLDRSMIKIYQHLGYPRDTLEYQPFFRTFSFVSYSTN